jgi:lysophospholipase L1-like esterase
MRWRQLTRCLARAALLAAWAWPADRSAAAATVPGTAGFDVVVYGGTAGGITAAVQAARMGKRAAIIDPSDHLGGMTSGGLGFTDVGSPSTIGGLSREFYHRVWQAYRDPAAWTSGTREQFLKVPGQGVRAIDEGAEVQWTFEPHVAERVLDEMVAAAHVSRLRGRLDRKGGVLKDGVRITGLRLEDGRTIAGRVFVDASYEGDVMAGAGVRYVVGREANGQYGETISGIQAAAATKNQLPAGIDAYLAKGNPAGGLLAGVNTSPGGTDGTADAKVQAYCYRLCLTDIPSNRLPIPKPAGYEERDFELVLRAIEAGQTGHFLSLDHLVPNHKTDSNNQGGISLDLIGGNYGYPDGDYAARDRIADAHKRWDLGLIYTLQHAARVPAKLRAGMEKWGLPKDEFTDNDHWPRQLYVREGRRMVGQLVECEPLLRDSASINDSVGMGSYAMDSHNVQRYADGSGHVRNEGDVEIPVGHPYRVSYRSLVPQAGQCDNVLVPWCLSASHAAYASIRMEPVFMALGQACGTAASLAIDGNTSVQAVPYAALRERLLNDKQVLDLSGGHRAAAADGADAGPVRVICLGDSITHRGYPQVLGELLHVTVANAGVDGDASRAGLARLPTELQRHPNVVVILFGTNDLRLDAPKVYEPPEQYGADLTQMVDKCRAAGVKPVLCTLPPIDAAAFFGRHDKAKFEAHGGLTAMLAGYRDAAVRVATEAKVPLVDLSTELPVAGDWHTVDGVHPTDEGTRRLAMLVARQVAPLLSVPVPPDAAGAH